MTPHKKETEYVLTSEPLTVTLQSTGRADVIKVRTLRRKDYLGLSTSRPRIITRDLEGKEAGQWNQKRRSDKGSRGQNGAKSRNT